MADEIDETMVRCSRRFAEVARENAKARGLTIREYLDGEALPVMLPEYRERLKEKLAEARRVKP